MMIQSIGFQASECQAIFGFGMQGGQGFVSCASQGAEIVEEDRLSSSQLNPKP